MRLAAFLLIGPLSLVAPCSRAGDAVVVGYNSEGAWTTVMYYCSSTPKGGTDYKSSAEAREAALRDLHKRGKGELVKTSVLSESDATGYAAVARAKTSADKDVIVVGYGKSQAAADAKALGDLKQIGGTSKQKIFYRYHSYGADAAAKP